MGSSKRRSTGPHHGSPPPPAGTSVHSTILPSPHSHTAFLHGGITDARHGRSCHCTCWQRWWCRSSKLDKPINKTSRKDSKLLTQDVHLSRRWWLLASDKPWLSQVCTCCGSHLLVVLHAVPWGAAQNLPCFYLCPAHCAHRMRLPLRSGCSDLSVLHIVHTSCACHCAVAVLTCQNYDAGPGTGVLLPVFPDNIVAFPNRDFIHLDGFFVSLSSFASAGLADVCVCTVANLYGMWPQYPKPVWAQITSSLLLPDCC